MSVEEHIASLRAKHHDLETKLEEEVRRPWPDDARVADLKKEKLRIKDALAQLSH